MPTMKHEQIEMFNAKRLPDSECLNAMLLDLVHYPELKVSFFVDKYSWSERKVKSIASISGGEILSSDKGYKLTRKATLAEVNHSYHRLKDQAQSTMERAESIRKFSHHVIG